jgi:hypothetical protein
MGPGECSLSKRLTLLHSRHRPLHQLHMWVRFLKSKDDTCLELEYILLEIRHSHALYHSSSDAITLSLNLTRTRSLRPLLPVKCVLGWVSVCSFPRHMLTTCSARQNTRGAQFGTTRRQCYNSMFVPNSMWSCAVSIVVYLRNHTFSRAVGPSGGAPLTLHTSTAPDASKFRVFGCTIFAKVHDKLRRKMGG